MDASLSHEELCRVLGEREFSQPPALIANAHITGLGVARALAAHDIPVVAVDRTGDGAAPPSTAVDAAGTVSYPLEDQSAFQDEIEALVDAAGTDMIGIGCMDEWVSAFAATSPAGVRLPFANREIVDTVLNKRSLYTLADELSIPYPETVSLATTSVETAIDRLGLPLVLKPTRKRPFEEALGTNVVAADSRDHVHAVLESAPTDEIEVLAQKKVNTRLGADRSYVSYRNPDGTVHGIVGNAAVRNPPTFGTSCLVERTQDPTLERRGQAILEETGYYGISEAEFVYDTDREEYLLLDVNTRPWKWIDLPVTAGYNLPLAAYSQAVGDSYTPTRSRDPTWLYLPDYLRALTQHDSVRDRLSVSDWQSLIDGSFEERPELTTAVFRPSDPRPTYQLLQTAVGTREYYCAC